nr:transposase [uncultured Pseudoxanthomonas sp.]
MSNYRRVWVPGGTYFFTVNLLERRRCLLVEHVDLLRDAFRAARAARPFHLRAIVVLPDHLHCVWRLPEGDADNANRWAQIKSGFSRALPAKERRSSRRIARRERGIWQRRYWEHLIRDDDDLRRHVDYVHINPGSMGMRCACATGRIRLSGNGRRRGSIRSIGCLSRLRWMGWGSGDGEWARWRA